MRSIAGCSRAGAGVHGPPATGSSTDTRGACLSGARWLRRAEGIGVSREISRRGGG
jgi:hypothetical protein